MKKLIYISFFCFGIAISSAQDKEKSYLAENTSSSFSTAAPSITYTDHLIEAKSFEMSPIKDFDEIEGLLIMKKLVAVPESGYGYVIDKLTHSKAFLNPKAKSILEKISKIFFDQNNVTLTVTSLTRSEKSQSSLRRVNSNAAKGDSTHNYGAAFDLSYTKFNEKYTYSKSNKDSLEVILKDMQNSGEIYFIKEHRQHCFHVTVRNPEQSISITM